MSGTNLLRLPLRQSLGAPVNMRDAARATLPMEQPPQAPPSGGVGDAPSPERTAMSFNGSRQTLMEHHQSNVAAFEESGKMLKRLDAVRKGLEKLREKQDIVTMDNVVEEAGKLVAHGIDPIALAGILADAPQQGGGEALGAWVAQHAQNAEQAEQQMMQQHKLLQHEMGSSAWHLMVAHANAKAMLGGFSPPMGDSGNGLSGSNGGGDGGNAPPNALAMNQGG